MEIVEGRKKCCLVEMRMIDADTECCSKIMVIGSRMSSFVEKGEKKKKNYISSGSSIFISTVCNVSLTSSLIRCIHFVVDRTIAHSTPPPPLSCLFVFVSNSRVVWCGFRTDGKRRGKKKKKGRTNEKKKQYARRWKAMFFLCWYDNRGMDVEARFDLPSWINIKPIRTLIRDGMDDGSTAEPTVNTRTRSSYALLFVPVRFNKTKARILDWTSAVARIWVATGKKIEESVQGKIIESDSIIVEITQLDTKGERGGDNAIMKTRGEI